MKEIDWKHLEEYIAGLGEEQEESNSKEERQKSWENIFDYECTFDDGERTI